MSSRRAVMTVSIFCLAAVLASPIAQGADVLTKVPAEAMVCVRAGNLEAAVGALDQFLVGVAPVPPLVPMMKMKLGKELEDPNMAALNMAGSWAFFAIAKDKDSEPEPYFVMPVKDVKALMAAKGVTKADANSISQIGGEDTSMLVQGEYAIVCPSENYASLAAMAKAKGTKTMADALLPSEKAGAASAPVWARVDLAKINALYGQEMAQQFEQLKNMPNAMGPMSGGSNKAMGAYFDAILALMKQTQALNISLTPKADSLTLSVLAVAVPDSEMAKTLSLGPTPKGSPELTAYLRDGAMMNYYARVNKPLLKKAYMAFFDLFAGQSGMSAQDLEKVKGLVTKGFEGIGDTVAGSVKGVPGGKPPFALGYIVQVADAKAMDDVVKEGRAMFNGGPIGNMYKGLGIEMSMTYSAQAVQYNGFAIDTTTASVKATDPNSPDAKMVEAIYGTGFKGCKAMGPGIMLVSVTADPETAVKKLIDEYKAGGPKEANNEFKAAMAIVPDAANADVIATYNYLRLFKSFSSLLPIPAIGEALAKVPESKSNLAIAARTGNGTVQVDVVLPKQHAQEIMGAVQQVQAQMMQQQRNSGGRQMRSRPMPD